MKRAPRLSGRICRFLAASAALMVLGEALADVRLPAIIASNMVLQADTDACLWGWADPGERVAVEADWLSRPVIGAADDHGRWKLRLRTPGYAGGDAFRAHTVTVSGVKNRITLDNVLIGEVWICSGQSNMEMPVGDHGGGYRGVADWKNEAAGANLPNIRLFDVQNVVSKAAEEDCRASSLGGKPAGWVACSPETVVDFSAAGFFFGRELFRSLNVPIGLVSSDWGGTPAEAWTSETALGAFPEFADSLAWMKTSREGKESAEDATAAWWRKIDEVDRRVMGAAASNSSAWAGAGYDDSSWSLVKLPSTWAGDLAPFDGIAWFRREIAFPADWAGKDLALSLGPIDDMDDAYLDGTRIGATAGENTWATPRTYAIQARLVSPGVHTLAIRVLDTSGPGGINGEPSQMMIGPASGKGDAVRIDGYWRYRKSAPASELPSIAGAEGRKLTPYTPAALYNGMIAPLTKMAMRGAIWYQGESNRGRAEQYARLFPAMIADWRREWGRGDFPFYFVQIAPFHYEGDKGETAEIRESQRWALRTVPNTGMAVTMDTGNPADIHPSNKQEVGRRLALWALARTYGKSGLEYSGPLPKGMTVKDGVVRVDFSHATGLAARGGALDSFEIAGPDGKFSPAQAEVAEGDGVRVWSESVPHPIAVRYGWCDACAPNLFNGTGLPASPFVLRAAPTPGD